MSTLARLTLIADARPPADAPAKTGTDGWEAI